VNQRFARIALCFVAEPGDVTLGALLRACTPAEAFAAICDGRPPRPAGEPGRRSAGEAAHAGIPGLGRAIERWAARLGRVPADSRLADWERAGIRLLCPGDPEWPTQLDVLGDARPLVLWVQGRADLRFACLRSVSVVGARAATGYGQHVAMEMAAALAERGWAVVSGGP
jgi:DNA processing protein